MQSCTGPLPFFIPCHRSAEAPISPAAEYLSGIGGTIVAERAVAGRGMRRANCFLDARPAVGKLAPVWNAALHATDLRKSQETPPPMNIIAVSDAAREIAVVALIFAIGTGIFAAPSLGGTGVFDYATGAVGEFSIVGQVTSQAWGVGTTILWSGIVSFVLFKLIDMVIGLRVTEEAEREGLDTSSHGERAYNM